jgi:hypothetical protein
MSTPIAAIGRLTFDADGKINGASSINFNGLFLRNPVRGTYELQSDCTLTWSLQDDSGGWQHFAGTLQPGGRWASFHQADSGTAGRGVLMRSANGCTAATMHGRYRFAMRGVSTPLGGAPPGERSEQETVTVADGNGNLQ